MRFGLDAREAFRYQPRGIGLYVRHLMREFGALAPADEFWLYHEREAPPDLPPLERNLRARRATIRGGRLHLWERLLLPWRLRADRLAVYHGTYNTLPPRWPLWRGPGLVVSLHDLIVIWHEGDLEDPYVRYSRAVVRRVARDADLILTVSEWSRRDIVERLQVPESKVRVFYNGANPDCPDGAPPGAGEAARATFAGGRPYVFALGATLLRKNTLGLLDALALLRQRGRLEHLVLIAGLGERERQPFVEHATHVGLDEQVRFLPYLGRAELIGLYAGAALTVYPSRYEGWGIPVVESLALGTPVATSGTSGMLEAGGPHATYFDPDDRGDIAAKIDAALQHPERFAAVRAAAIARARGFTWRRAAEVTLAAYREVAGNSRAGPGVA
jgi:glycosyltransferase involved in cell wall biosynthesis